MAVSSVPAQPPPPAAQRQVEWVSIDDLLLDPLNPRLPDGMENASQPQLLRTLAREYHLQDLGQSIADNGYFAEEPLVAVPAKTTSTFTVVEGNRRLAALKLLANPAAAPTTSRKRWEGLSDSRHVAVTEAPVLIYQDRAQVAPYLGFRHITGVLPWDPYQKGRYIAQLIELQHKTLQQAARDIGSTSPVVRDHYIQLCDRLKSNSNLIPAKS
jgi:ParB-like chromosome segregation protein Spo0J